MSKRNCRSAAFTVKPRAVPESVEQFANDDGRHQDIGSPQCATIHDRNHNAARNLLKLALLAVGEDVTLLDGAALASDETVAGETAPDEGRTKPRTEANTQLTLAM